MKHNSSSLKVKLVAFVLCILLVVTASLTFVLVKNSRERVMEEAKKNGMSLVTQISNKLVFANNAQKIIDNLLSNKVETTSFLIGQKDNLSNEYLQELSKVLAITEINIVDTEQKIIYSNMEANLGYVYPEDHGLSPLFNGTKQFISEAVRQSTVDGKDYKYGGARTANGLIVQVGIEAKAIQDINKKASFQAVIEQSVTSDDVLYSLVIDTNSVAIAHNNTESIGKDLSDDKGVQTVLETRKPYATEFEWANEGEVYHTYDCFIPLEFDGELVGIINVGISLQELDNAINEMVLASIIIAVVSMIISFILLYLIIGYALKPLVVLSDTAYETSRGNLNQTLTIKSKDEIGSVSSSFNDMIVSLRQMITQINDITNGVFESTKSLVITADQVTNITTQIASATNEVAAGTEAQVEAINEAATNVKIVVENIKVIQDEVHNVSNESNNNEVTVKKAEERVHTMSAQMDKIRSSVSTASDSMVELKEISIQIGDIVSIINSIADQTNLLALNASIEAARAGEHGKGFAVVADEIRKLAEESRNSTDNIKALIEQTQNRANQAMDAIDTGNTEAEIGETLLKEVSSSFRAIDNGVSVTRQSMTNLTDRTNSITESIQLVYKMIESVEDTSQMSAANSEEVAASTDEQAASVEEITATIQSLEEMMHQLKASVDMFDYK